MNRPARVPRQLRSEEALGRIARAVTDLLAGEGQGALTHRRVASAANVSLAATTYYYSGKFDMIDHAASRLLDAYIEAFVRARDRHRSGDLVIADLPTLIAKLIKNAAGHHGHDTLAWCEIMLDCARHSEGRAIARRWLLGMDRAWTELVAELGYSSERLLVGSAIDTVMGLLFFTVPLNLSIDEVGALLDRREPLALLRGDPDGSCLNPVAEGLRLTNKSRETRDRIIDAAVRLLLSGETILSYSAVAGQANLSTPAATYHFASISELRSAAQTRLLEAFATRHQARATRLLQHAANPSSVAEATAQIFAEDIGDDGLLNLAALFVCVDAARKPELRPMVGLVLLQLLDGWKAILDAIGAPNRPDYALFAFAQFHGRMIRALSTGSSFDDTGSVEWEFRAMFDDLKAGTYPLTR